MVIDRSTSLDVYHGTVTKQNFDLASENHAKVIQVLSDRTEVTDNEYTNDTPPTLEANNLHNDNITRGGKYNLGPNPQPKFSDIFRYSRCHHTIFFQMTKQQRKS